MRYLQERQEILSALPKYILRRYSQPHLYVSSKNIASTIHPRYQQKQPYQLMENLQYTHIHHSR